MDLEAIAKLIEEQRYDAAVMELNALDTAAVRDAALHRRVADLALAAGAGPRLLAELNLAHRDAPDDPDVLRRLAQAHEDCGSVDRAVKAWKTLTERKPDDVEAWDSLAALLRDIGRGEEAREVVERALRATNDRRFRALGRAPQVAVEVSDAEGVPGDPVMVRFVSLFEGREGVYARQWASEQGAVGYTPVREPFNVKVARNHVMGNHTVGIYPLRLDNTVNFGAIDFDLPKAFVERSSPGRKEWNDALGRMLEYADNVRQAGQDRGLRVYLEDSGWKGLHCWVFVSTPLPARVMRKLLDTLVGVAGTPPQGISFEVFPKQNVLPLDKLGNLIKLPLGIHRRTGRRAEWLDEFGMRIDDQQGYLMQVQRMEAEIVYRFLEQTVAPAPLEVVDDSPPFEIVPAAQGRQGARTVDYALEQDLEYMTMMTRCVTLRELARKAEVERHLSNDEAMVLVHSLGHMATGPAAVNALLAKCPGTDESLRLKGRLRGNPISCGRIRGRIPHITSQLPCNCQFEVAAGLYPNPLLHLGAHDGGEPVRLQALRVEAMLGDFLRSRKALHEAQRMHEDACERLGRYFDDAGIDTLPTPYGSLQRVSDAEGRKVFRLDV